MRDCGGCDRQIEIIHRITGLPLAGFHSSKSRGDHWVKIKNCQPILQDRSVSIPQSLRVFQKKTIF